MPTEQGEKGLIWEGWVRNRSWVAILNEPGSNHINNSKERVWLQQNHRWVWWLCPVIPATWRIRQEDHQSNLCVLQSKFKVSPGNLARPSLKIKNNRKSSGCCSVEHLPGMCEALGSFPNTTKKKWSYSRKLPEGSFQKTIPASLREDVTEFSFVYDHGADIRWQRDSPGTDNYISSWPFDVLHISDGMYRELDTKLYVHLREKLRCISPKEATWSQYQSHPKIIRK